MSRSARRIAKATASIVLVVFVAVIWAAMSGCTSPPSPNIAPSPTAGAIVCPQPEIRSPMLCDHKKDGRWCAICSQHGPCVEGGVLCVPICDDCEEK